MVITFPDIVVQQQADEEGARITHAKAKFVHEIPVLLLVVRLASACLPVSLTCPCILQHYSSRTGSFLRRICCHSPL